MRGSGSRINMTHKQLAKKIVDTLAKHSAPGKCTWGDLFPAAHGELFGATGYYDDLVDDVEAVLIGVAHDDLVNEEA